MDVSWVEKFCGLRVFVLGDVMLDRYVGGVVERVSPEAPIPILRYRSENTMLGGAGNVARNIAGLGGQAVLASVCA
jgi:D-beta-D-heptose 7-phosphate kinase / D-beta-D-heptose 1-phosphate adenosyltransferase